MPVSENLVVQMHQQDTSYYCGAACAQMVLESIGAGLLDQDGLYADNHSHSTLDAGVNWATGPDGLQWTMMDRRPPGFTNYFALYALDTEDLLSRKLCWTIHHYQVAPIALVYGWAHWIVVRGYTASAHPASSGDNTYTIDAFDINNPWPPTPSEANPALAPPPPHSAADGCGSGGGGDRGTANEHITYAHWCSTYMTGVPGGHWSGKFVAVCDPEPPAQRGGPVRRAPQRRGDGELLGARAVTELALQGLREYGLFERKDWAATLRRAKPASGVMVQRLDHADSFYSVVPFQSGKGTVAFAAVDGRWGDYLHAVLLPKPQTPWLSLEQAFKLIVGKRIELGAQKGRLLIRKQAVCLYPHLVWRPCFESLSPFYPFYMFTVGSQRVYVRVDGTVFASLTLNMKGV